MVNTCLDSVRLLKMESDSFPWNCMSVMGFVNAGRCCVLTGVDSSNVIPEITFALCLPLRTMLTASNTQALPGIQKTLHIG